jgi:hypothetical protein
VIGLCTAFQVWSIGRKGPVLVSVFNPFQTVFSAFVSFVFFGEWIGLGWYVMHCIALHCTHAGIQCNAAANAHNTVCFCNFAAALWGSCSCSLDCTWCSGPRTGRTTCSPVWNWMRCREAAASMTSQAKTVWLR